MNWKTYKNKVEQNTADPGAFVLGFDIGEVSTCVAVYDAYSASPQIIDLSGGFGKTSVPTVMQYIPSSKEWVFGEYAVLNRGAGDEITLYNVVSKLGKKEFIEAGGKPLSVVYCLALFIKEVVSNCKSINPKAPVAGIVATCADYSPPDAIFDIYAAFKMAGLEKELICVAPASLCCFKKYFFGNSAAPETAVLLDFGGQRFRGGVYEIIPGDSKTVIRNLSYQEDETLGAGYVFESAKALFTRAYSRASGAAKFKRRDFDDLMSVFTYKHTDMLFLKSAPQKKPVKLYFTFSHPPFSENVAPSEVESLTRPFSEKLSALMADLFEKNIYGAEKTLDPAQVDAVILSGGGFEMPWAKQQAAAFFKNAPASAKNTKDCAAQGACVIAAESLGLIPERAVEFDDKLKLTRDYGFFVTSESRERFIPLAPKGSLWPGVVFSRRVLVRGADKGGFALPLYSRDDLGECVKLGDLSLAEPQGAAAFFNVSARFNGCERLIVKITNEGFGALLPKTDCARECAIDLA